MDEDSTALDSRPVIKPQEGPQEAFLSTPADVALFGGAAFGGKSYALLMEPLRHVGKKGFNCVIFRRTYTEITSPGGLWDESQLLYPSMGGRPVLGSLEWRFPAGSVIKFAHLQFEENKLNWNGAQVCLIEFDQLESFTKTQWQFLFKANRSSCGVSPYIRATLNPDPNSFLRELLDWWIYPDDFSDADKRGLPIPPHSGVLRYFKVDNDQYIWADEKLPGYQSFTFIASSRFDNKIGMATNPEYESRLEGLAMVDRMRLRDGNWSVPPGSGGYFQKAWFEFIPAEPLDLVTVIRYWDRAATEPNPNSPDPDWTVGVKMGWDARGYTYILDAVRVRLSPGGVVDTIKNTASQDGHYVLIGLEQEPGAAGKSEAQTLVRELGGYNVRAVIKTQSKETAAKPLSVQAEAKNVKIVKGPWNDPFIKSLESFPNGSHDDDVDSASGAYNMHVSPKVRWLPPSNYRKPAEQNKPLNERGETQEPFYPIRRIH